MSGSARVVHTDTRERLEHLLTRRMFDHNDEFTALQLERLRPIAAQMLQHLCVGLRVDPEDYRVEVWEEHGTAYPGSPDERPHSIRCIRVRELSAIDRLAELV